MYTYDVPWIWLVFQWSTHFGKLIKINIFINHQMQETKSKSVKKHAIIKADCSNYTHFDSTKFAFCCWGKLLTGNF